MTGEPRPSRSKTLRRVGIGLALGLTASGLGAFWYARFFLNERLSPLISEVLARQLKRPVQLGAIERVSFTGVRFGATQIPATPTQPNFLVADGVDLAIDPWSYLRDRTVGLDATIERPRVYLRQDLTTGSFLPRLEPPTSRQRNPIDLRTVRVRDGQLTLQPAKAGGAVTLTQLQIESDWAIVDPANQHLELAAKGKVVLPEGMQANVVPEIPQLERAIAASRTDGGRLNSVVRWDLTRGEGTIALRGQNLIAPSLQGFLTALPFSPTAGRLDGTTDLFVQRGDRPLSVRGDIRVRDVSLVTRALPQPITGISGNVVFDNDATDVRGLTGNYNALIARADGTFSAQAGFNMEVALEPTDLAKALASLGFKPAVPVGGEVKAIAKLSGKTPSIAASFEATKPIAIDKVVLQRVRGHATLANLSTLTISQLTATPALGGKVAGGGQIRLPQGQHEGSLELALNLGGVSAEKVATLYNAKLPIAVGAIAGRAQAFGSLSNPQVLLQLAAPQATYPMRGEVLLANGLAQVRRAIVQFPIGAVAVSGRMRLTGTRAWRARVVSNGIPLSAFAKGQLGTVAGVADLNSPSGSFDLNEIFATATLHLPRGAARIPEAIAARLTWDGRALVVPALQVGQLLAARGTVDVTRDKNRRPTGIAGIQLTLNTGRIPLARLRSLVPNLPQRADGTATFSGTLAGALDRLQVNGALQVAAVSVAGLLPASNPSPLRGALSFDGRVVGNLTQPQVRGALRLEGLATDRLTFDSVLSGPLQFSFDRGLSVMLQGTRDRLQVMLDNRLLPVEFALQLAGAEATGRRSDNNDKQLDVILQNLPVSLVAAIAGQKDADGRLSGQFAVDLTAAPRIRGQAIAVLPRFGRFQAERLTAQLVYADGALALTEGRIQLPPADETAPTPGEYRFDLNVTPQGDAIARGSIRATNGQVRDVFALLQWFEFSDIAQGISPPRGRARDLVGRLQDIGRQNDPLYAQLGYFSQIRARLDQEEANAAERNVNLPPLAEFNGSLEGAVEFALNRRSGLGLAFDLTGKAWEYGKFAIQDVAAKGSFRDGMLDLIALNLQSGNSRGQITNARLGLLEQSGQIELTDFPIETLRPLPLFDTIPFDITGKTNGKATIGGNLFNPKIEGDLALTEPTIDRQPLAAVRSSFSLNNGRLKFSGLARADGSEPMNVSGDVPLRLPFALVTPGNRIALNIDVRNEGLALMNFFNPSVRWVEGKGAANLIISGTTTRPQVQGRLTLDGAKVQAASLPGDISDLRGTIDFSLDRLSADLRGRFSDGQITAKGILAIADPRLIAPGTANYGNPLTIFAERLQLDLKDVYAGAANGFVVVRGAALSPEVSGEIALSDGRIFLAGNESKDKPQEDNGNGVALRFNQLIVKLRENIQVTRAPLLNLLAEGDITVNGSLRDLQPSGRINILRGQVNAISARFRLERAYDNYAEFIPAQGLNPNLNVRVLGAIPEVKRTPIASTPFDSLDPSSKPVSNFGEQGTLQVQATVTGTALNPNISLRSTPPRTEAEILALIGGGLLQGGGDAAAALANLAGGTIVTFLQDAIGDVLNLSEFNLSPTTTRSVGGRSTSLGLAAEAAVDISRSFSAAVRGVINDPAQTVTYTLRYRVDPRTLVRTSSDFQGNNSAAIEFETRF